MCKRNNPNTVILEVKHLRCLTWPPCDQVLHFPSSLCTQNVCWGHLWSSTSTYLPGAQTHSWPRQEQELFRNSKFLPWKLKKKKKKVQELSHLIVKTVNYLAPCTSLTYHSSQQWLTGILTSFRLLFACRREDEVSQPHVSGRECWEIQ